MDKNTITGLVMIGVLLVAFSYFSRPSAEQQAAWQHYNDSVAAVQQKEREQAEKMEAIAAEEAAKAIVADTTALFHSARAGEERFDTIANNRLTLVVSNLGGRICAASLPDYKAQDRETPVQLFDEASSTFNVTFYQANSIVNSRDCYFQPVERTDSSLVMRLAASAEQYIDFRYTLSPNSYLVDFKIEANGMSNLLAASARDLELEWMVRIKQQEKGFTYENRLSELTYKTSEGVDNLSAASNDEETLPQRATWIAFKDQFFSSVMIADGSFGNVKLKSRTEHEGSGFIKRYDASMDIPFDPTGAKPTQMYIYLGPNHYKTLASLDNGQHTPWELDRLVYLGWPIIRWINKYVTINVFDWLRNWGLSMGMVLLVLTILMKIVVYPATWKTYISSARMRVLKPKVDEIGRKYPDKSDALKKQQEVMALYSQYGVSPMGGCLPMLLQFPVLMALFMFVPSAIELRQQSFLWADDLSTYDAIIQFPFNIPFMGNHLSLFCLLMTVTNLLNTRYTMSMQDNGSQQQMPAMKWMMYLMPVMFLFVLNSYPSGLNYYYFVSTLISVITMIVLRRRTDEAALLADLEAHKKDPKQATKTGFAARLEAMQKQQEQLARERRERKQ
jgi:YidC/Oxa1 family membrane protein insertase